ncbi:hypothetical protein MDA_GLEAN10007797 [Myotis davidii]|uniref:Uncharacterized protein n=1 Tax=Myotis davidii TaxID=225400 RepID=L5LMX2_MYODS|nr:hypothetical protein MDA_GLEAN10007797 [Myotis davidii]
MITGWLRPGPGLKPQAEALGLDLGTTSSPPPIAGSAPVPAKAAINDRWLARPSPSLKPLAEELSLGQTLLMLPTINDLWLAPP